MTWGANVELFHLEHDCFKLIRHFTSVGSIVGGVEAGVFEGVDYLCPTFFGQDCLIELGDGDAIIF
ncbi:hypothetical protein D3C87_1913880 [compost metagenome]